MVLKGTEIPNITTRFNYLMFRAPQNAKTFMEPWSTGRLAEDIDTLEHGSGSGSSSSSSSSSSSGGTGGIGTANSGNGGGGGSAAVKDSIANSKQVAEVTLVICHQYRCCLWCPQIPADVLSIDAALRSQLKA